MTRHGAGFVWVLLLAVTGLPAAVAPAAAQRFTVELKAGASVGTFTETGAGLELVPAGSFGATGEVRLAERVTVYAGGARSRFGCQEGFCADRDVTLTSQGLVAGARWSLGLLWARTGLAARALEVRSGAGIETSDVGLGWDLGAGLELPLARGVRLRPGVTYVRHGAAIDTGDGHAAVFAFELGLAAGI